MALGCFEHMAFIAHGNLEPLLTEGTDPQPGVADPCYGTQTLQPTLPERRVRGWHLPGHSQAFARWQGAPGRRLIWNPSRG